MNESNLNYQNLLTKIINKKKSRSDREDLDFQQLSKFNFFKIFINVSTINIFRNFVKILILKPKIFSKNPASVIKTEDN